jgi:hypothetical protein
MRTLILALAVILLAAPAWADVEIKLEGDPGNARKVWIKYDATGETDLVRAFALNIQATDGNIIDCNDFTPGDDTGGFGVFPGKFASVPIDVNPTTGQVDNWYKAGYDPVAPAGDPDALGEIPGPGITVEMGSLYDSPTNAPGKEGILCSITLDDDVSKVCVTGNAIRGNVVLETAAEAVLNPAEVCYSPVTECIPPSDPGYTFWDYRGKPDCWCPVGTGDIGGNPSAGYQCYGDTDNVAQWGIYRIFTDDLAVLAAEWKKVTGDPTLNACADLTHADQWGIYAVFTDDLAIMAANWKKLDYELTPNCRP